MILLFQLLANSHQQKIHQDRVASDSKDIDEFSILRAECAGNLLIGFLNINSLRNKITELRMIAERCLHDVLLLKEETK